MARSAKEAPVIRHRSGDPIVHRGNLCFASDGALDEWQKYEKMFPPGPRVV